MKRETVPLSPNSRADNREGASGVTRKRNEKHHLLPNHRKELHEILNLFEMHPAQLEELPFEHDKEFRAMQTLIDLVRGQVLAMHADLEDTLTHAIEKAIRTSLGATATGGSTQVNGETTLWELIREQRFRTKVKLAGRTKLLCHKDLAILKRFNKLRNDFAHRSILEVLIEGSYSLRHRGRPVLTAEGILGLLQDLERIASKLGGTIIHSQWTHAALSRTEHSPPGAMKIDEKDDRKAKDEGRRMKDD